MTTLPLHKVLISSQIASRRYCTQAIKEGRVRINNNVVRNPLHLIDCKKDSVKINGKRIDVKKIFKKDYVYYLLNKPKGFICTAKDAHSRRTVLDLIKEDKRIYPVGRLDKDTEGLLILTNDGSLTYRLTHPKFEIDKVYEALITPCISKKDIEKLKKGVYIDKDCRVSGEIKLLKDYKLRNQTKLEVTIHQGIKRQIRRMFTICGYKVLELERICLGSLKLSNLKRGESRRLSDKEINSLRKLVGMNYD